MSDRLERALRALREEQTGEDPGSEETLERILVSRRTTGPAWAKRARTLTLLAAVLVIATTALARSGALKTVRNLVTNRQERPGQTEKAGALSRPSGAAMPPELPSPALSAEPVRTEVAPTWPALTPTATPTAPPRLATPSIPHSSSSPAPPPAPSSSPAPAQSEVDAYARAHRLHFDRDEPASALAAWDDYLRRYPDGRFAPDAGYNRAIDLLKLKRFAEARAALQPFADGAFGGYHRDDARELLRSIP